MRVDELSEYLRSRILGVLGLSLAACSSQVDTDEPEGTTSGGTATTGSGPGSTSRGAGEGWDEQSCDPETIERTICAAPDGADGSTGDATEDSTTTGAGESSGSTGTGESSGSTGSTGDADDTTSDPSMDTSSTGDADYCSGFVPEIDWWGCGFGSMSEVFEQDGECCVTVVDQAHCCEGRPFIVDDDVRTAPVQRRGDWSMDRLPDTSGLSPEERRALGVAWQQDALMEHASIASFARFVLQLLAVGAPPELVEDAQRAMRDEIEHARIAFGFAGAYLGERIGPGPLDVDGALEDAADLAAAVAATVREGCIGETTAALQAALGAAHATDPCIRGALEQIAEDETRHALLAWRFVAWAIARGGERVRLAAERAFASARVEHRRAVSDEPEAAPNRSFWQSHGRLDPADRVQLQARAMASVVLPCAAALAGHDPTAKASQVAPTSQPGPRGTAGAG